MFKKKNQTNLRSIVALVCGFCCLSGVAQPLSNLPIWGKKKSIIETDWLNKQSNVKARLFQTKGDKLVFANGQVTWNFSNNPDGATVGLNLFANNESFYSMFRTSPLGLGV